MRSLIHVFICTHMLYYMYIHVHVHAVLHVHIHVHVHAVLHVHIHVHVLHAVLHAVPPVPPLSEILSGFSLSPPP